jgi:LysM repeat protein
MTYEVKQGDTINSILQKTGISLEKLLRLNPFLLDLELPEKTIIYVPDNKMETAKNV